MILLFYLCEIVLWIFRKLKIVLVFACNSNCCTFSVDKASCTCLRKMKISTLPFMYLFISFVRDFQFYVCSNVGSDIYY